MKKTIEIPEGYEARIEGNKVILELKESEDERIRKHIIKILDSLAACHWDGNEKAKCIAYLERQKEQKPVQDKEEREYVRTLKSLIADFLRDKEDVNRGYYQDIYDWLDGRHIEQKPAEWSEEDKLHLNNAILVAKKEWGVNSYTARWLESLRDNYKKCNSRWKPSKEQTKAREE